MICPYCGGEFATLQETRQRSLPQNKYYWGCIIDILSKELGYQTMEMHEILKSYFLTEKKHITVNKTGKHVELDVTHSTTDLSTKSFEEYMEHIRTWASSDLGIYIPAPHEVTFNE